MTNRIHLKKILWIYILAFVLTAFSFHSKAEVSMIEIPDETVSYANQ